MKASNPITPPAVVAAGEITDPLTGELIPTNDVDALIDAYERLKAMAAEITTARGEVSKALAAMTTGDAKTRRIVGKRRSAKIEMPGTSWSNSRLKEAYHSYPQYRDLYLRIAEVAPDLVQVKKLRETTGPADLENFKKMVLAAEGPPTGNPYVTVEK